MLREFDLCDESKIRIVGRTAGNRKPLALFWTGSGIECNAKAGELWLEAECGYEIYEPWISIIVNGEVVSRRMLDKGRHWLCIFRGMDPDKVKSVIIAKDTQAMTSDAAHYVLFHSIKTDGEFMPLEKKRYKIEAIGDSLTSGEGAIGAEEEEDWISMFFSSRNNYATILGEKLNADIRIISQSGWGVCSSWNNNPHQVVLGSYERVAGLLEGQKNEELGAFEMNDFTAWQPNLIISMLGANDFGAFHMPAWKDEETGETFEQRMDNKNKLNAEDEERFKEKVKSGLYKIRRYNPHAWILWVGRKPEALLHPAISKAVAEFQKESGDGRVAFTVISGVRKTEMGARKHPGALAQKRMAKEIFDYIQKYDILS